MSVNVDLNHKILTHLDADRLLPPLMRAYLTTVAFHHDYPATNRAKCRCGRTYPCRELVGLAVALGVQDSAALPDSIAYTLEESM